MALDGSSYLDMQFPVFAPGMDVNEKLEQIVNYLAIMRETLQYSLHPEEKVKDEKSEKMLASLAGLEESVAGINTVLTLHQTKISTLSDRTKSLGIWGGYLDSRDEWDDL